MNEPQDKRRTELLSYTIPIGAGLGVALGLLLMTILDHKGLFGLGIAIGLAIGVTVGLVQELREGDDHVGH